MTTAERLLAAGYVQDALPQLREDAWRLPSYKSFLNLSVALRCSGEFEAALVYLAKAVTLDPSPFNAYLTLGNVYSDLGEWEHALGCYDSAFNRVMKPAMPIASVTQVALAYSQALLRQRRFKEAWPLWEMGRFGRSYWALPGTKRWLGEPCDSLLVMCEGGFGDAMLFARWLSFAATRAKYVRLLIWDSMIGLWNWHALDVDEVIPKSMEIDATGIEYTTSWMSLPAIAGLEYASDIPDSPRLKLRCDPTPGKNRIGFCWRAEENSQYRRSRSLHHAAAQTLAATLANYGEVTSLVPKKSALYNKNDFEIPSGVTQDESLLADWRTTASTIRSCKFVITVDTAVAHLAGLCGVPTLLLLPCSSDWKWGTAANTPTDPWYGSHVQYYRNQSPLAWNTEEIAACITRL